MNLKGLAAAAVLLLGAAPLAPRGGVSAQGPTYRSRATFVQVDAAVTDLTGAPVLDLTKDDFEVFDNGRRQTITTFAVVGGARRGPRTPLPRIGEPIVPGVEDEAADITAPRLVVIVLDDVWTLEELSDRARTLVAAVLSRLQPNDSVALTLTGPSEPGRRTIRTVGESRDAILAELAGVKGRSSCFGPREFGSGNNPVLTIMHICESLKQVKHLRKAIVWIGDRVSAPMIDPLRDDRVGGDFTRPAFRTNFGPRLIQAAWQNDVAIYGLDPRRPEDWERERLGCGDNILHRERVATALHARDTLPSLTGGMLLVDVTDFDAAIDRILEDVSTYYLLGFAPDDLKANGRFRPLDVRVRRPGLTVRARRGYWAPRRGTGAPATGE